MTKKTKTELSCNDMQKFTEIMKSVSFKNSKILLGEEIAEIVSRNGYPGKEILNLSKENPDLIFNAKYSLASENYNTIRILEYSQGQAKEVGLRPHYTTSDYSLYIKPYMGDSHDMLLDRALEIFNRIDLIKEHENGQKYIDFENEITLTVEDEHFQMQLKKERAKIYYKGFRKSKKIEVTLIPVENDMDIPF